MRTISLPLPTAFYSGWTAQVRLDNLASQTFFIRARENVWLATNVGSLVTRLTSNFLWEGPGDEAIYNVGDCRVCFYLWLSQTLIGSAISCDIL